MRGVLVRVAMLMAALGVLVSAADPPRLVVLIVVDQMRADYVDRFRTDWTAGLKRLVERGAWFTGAAYPYLSTYTCAGHATIGTGALPYRHGVFQNTFFDRVRNQMGRCTDDPVAKRIPYGKEGSQTHGPAQLGVPTLGDEMRKGGSRVVALALKARSAIMLAGHGGDAVTWLSETFDSWETSSVYSPAPVPEVKAFLDANPIEADYGKTWSRLLPEDRYPEVDAGLGENPPKGWTSTFPHVLKGDADDTRPDEEFYGQWERSPYADAYLGRLAQALVTSMQLGRGQRPELLAISFSTPDLVGHKFGPDSHEVRDVYAHLDRTLGNLLDHLDRTVGRDAYVLALSSDHGVTRIPEQAQRAGQDAGRIRGREISAAVQGAVESALGPGRYVARINFNDIYLQPGVYTRLAGRPKDLAAVVAAVESQPGVARVFTADQLAAGRDSTDPLLRTAALSYVPVRAGDLVMVFRRGWVSTSDATNHGSAQPEDQRVPLILFGRGIKPGRFQQAATPADIAPTLGHLVHVTLSQADGRVLREALR